MKNYYFFRKCWVFGLQNEHSIAFRKNDVTTVFVAQSTDPPIKNGVHVLRNAAREPSNQFTNPEDAQDILDKIEFGAQFYNDNPSDFRLRYYHMTSITENYIVLPFNSIVIDLAPMIAGVLTEKRPLSEVKLIISY